MKKIFITSCLGILLLLFISFSSTAQELKKAQDLFNAGQYDKARASIDTAVNGIEGKKTATWIWKHKICLAIANSDVYKNLFPDARRQGYEALRKARSMPDADEAFMKELVFDAYQPFNDYYVSFINEGAAQMNAGIYDKAFENFKSALSVSAFFYENKLIPNELDTSLTFYAGYSAMKTGNDTEAEYYFKKLADKNVNGADQQITYGWLCNYYIKKKKDLAAANSIYEKGISYYPNDEYLRSMKIAIANASGNMENIFKIYEETIASGEAVFTDYLAYGAELYDYLYIGNPVDSVTAAKKETRMVEVLNKALSLKEESAEANYIMGMYHATKATSLDNKIRAIKTLTPENVKKKKELQNSMNEMINKSVSYLEAASSLYAASSDLSPAKKENFKTALQQLINLYNYLKQEEKSNTTAERLANIK